LLAWRMDGWHAGWLAGWMAGHGVWHMGVGPIEILRNQLKLAFTASHNSKMIRYMCF
jgi:hypothetical protein